MYSQIFNIDLSSTNTISLDHKSISLDFNYFSSLQSGYSMPSIDLNGKEINTIISGQTVSIYVFDSSHDKYLVGTVKLNDVTLVYTATNGITGTLNLSVMEVDESDPKSLHVSGGSNIMSQIIDMNSHKIINLVDPTNDQDAVTLKYFNDNGGGGTPTPTPGDRGVFGGGSGTNNMDYITISIPSNSLFFGELSFVSSCQGTSNGSNDRGIFGVGGLVQIEISTPSNAVDFGAGVTTVVYGSATSNGTNDRGIFATGRYDGYSADIDYITISIPGLSTFFGYLTVIRHYTAGTSNGTNDRGVVGGGANNVIVNIIDYITISSPGNASDFGDLVNLTQGVNALSNDTNNRGIFAGGNGLTEIEYINITSPGNAQYFGDLGISHSSGGGTSNGINDRGVVGGGGTNIIDYITISSPGNAQYFSELRLSTYTFEAAISNS